MVGIDIVFLDEFARQTSLGGDHFLFRTFSDEELNNKHPEHLAGIFAAKEAVIKALSLMPGSWQRINICYKPSGQPFAEVEGRTIAVSIAHHGDYAVAIAVDSQT